MSVFAIIAPDSAPKLEEAVKAKYEGGNFYRIAPGQFLVYSPTLITQQVSDSLGIKGGELGSAIVIRVTGYAGWHTKAMWEWIDTHLDPPPAPAPPSETPSE